MTLLRDWEALLCTLIRTAIDAGELPADADPAELAYELDALGQTVVTRARLLDSDTVFAHARASLHARLTPP
ncbi:TetR family transcriptional regulator C-terminal domain-containing protein [Nocardia terpenica]|uniref:Tetracyclin repressor-like C-terminal domain-containing protein n=1 Tax=Nocardia terpenica TaxID=455432 RepID=A0A6G9Z047_9NOCA|nr:hypothetical protein [Nocardia terpenica]QIS18832.1 hypothetical protein F6W96_11515 [Nocardia terpenica]